jgi:trigger factor
MIPGFEDGLVGLSAGEETVLKLKFPKDYHAEELKGKAVQFAVKVNAVSSKQMPELNDEFFKIYGVEEGGEAKFREDVQGNMERELRNAIRTKVKNRVMNQLFDLNKVELPEALVSNEITQLKQQMVQQFGGGQQIDLSMLPDDMFKEKAERRAALGVIVSELVKVEEMTPNEEQVRARVDEIASTYEQPREVVDYYYSKPELLSSVEAVVLEDQVTELVLSKAKVKEEAVSYEEAVKPDPEPGTEA